MKLAHTADTHLDDQATVPPGRRVLDSQGRNIRGEDRRRCFAAVVDGAIAHGCGLFLHAGDLYNDNTPTPAETCAAQEGLDRVVQHMPAVLCGDNHGNVESATERHAIEPLAGRHPRLYVSVRPELLRIPTDAGLVQVATLPSPKRSIVAGREDIKGLTPQAVNALISEKLRGIIRGFRAQLDPGSPAILMIHGKLIGAWLNDVQQAAGTEEIALTPEDLEGWDYVALGDFHKMQQVAPNAWYAGSSDRTDASQEHQAVGWLCVTLEGPAMPPTVLHVETPARRFVTLEPGQLQDKALFEQYDEVPLAELPIVRVKGQITQAEAEQLQPFLAHWRTLPTFSESITITRQTSARAAAVTDELDPEAALAEWTRLNNREADLPAILAEHRALTQAGD